MSKETSVPILVLLLLICHDFRPNKPDYNNQSRLIAKYFPFGQDFFRSIVTTACWKMFHLANRYKTISVISVKHRDSRVNKTNCFPPDHCSKKVWWEWKRDTKLIIKMGAKRWKGSQSRISLELSFARSFLWIQRLHTYACSSAISVAKGRQLFVFFSLSWTSWKWLLHII